MDRLPLELLELLLLRTFVKLFTDHYKSQFNVRRVSVQRSYSALAAVCYNWWQTMNGWPQSPTGHWFRHKLQTRIKYACRPFPFRHRLQHIVTTSSDVGGVAYCDNKLFAVCRESGAILVFGPNFEPLTSIDVSDLRQPNDIVACTESEQLYIADRGSNCVWRVPLNGGDIVRWISRATLKMSRAMSKTQSMLFYISWIPWSLSLVSRRLLVTSTNGLVQFDNDGHELNRIAFVDRTLTLQHAVETSRQTFVVIRLGSTPRISEVDSIGVEIRVYEDPLRLAKPWYLALDSDGRIFVVDNMNGGILLLDSHLQLERFAEDDKQRRLIEDPSCMCYVERTGQLIIAGKNNASKYINVFNIR